MLLFGLSLDVVPRLCRLRTVRCRLVCVQDLTVLATYSSKPDILAIPLCEKTTAHWECGDGESSVYTSYESITDERRRKVEYCALG